MTSASVSGSADGTMAHLSPSASTTLPGIPTQSDDRTNVMPTSSGDVESTRAHWDELQLLTESQSPFSIGEPSSSLEDELSDISQTINSVSSSIIPNTSSVADVTPTVQSMPPSLNSASSVNPSTEYSSGASSFLSPTPSLPQSISASQTDIRTSNSGLVSSSTAASSTSEVILKPSSSQNVIKTSVPKLIPSVSKTKDKLPSKTGGIPLLPTKAYKTATSTWSYHDESTDAVVTTSSVIAGVLPTWPNGVTPYSGDTKDNKTGYVEPRSGYPNATILFIIVPVCVVVILVLSAILVACVRRKKYTKKPTTNQNPDLWVNTRTEIALVPTTASGVDTSTETVAGFKPGDIVCRVVYPFKAQLEGQMTLTEKELIKILEKADNGWWRGATQNGEHSGWFPGCYVEEVKPGDIEDGTQSQSKGKSRVSSFMLKKRERIRRRSATAVSPLEMNSDSSIPYIPTSRTLPALNSAEINKFNDGRIFKTLFSYHASSKGELSIEEGDIVRGWEKDRNGWMHGRKVVTGEEGWFPAVYVDEVPSDTSSISGESTLSGPIMYDQLAPNKTRKSDQEWLGIEHRAIHSYLGKSETDLVFEAGDTIIIYETLDNGWWLGSHGEDVGWLPGSYLEILDSSRDDESSKSDVSSLLSSNDDRNRTLEDELSHMTSNQSLNSTLSDSKPKPKPVRKAPPPPKLKPLKIPIRDIGQHSQQSVKSELHNVILSNQSPVDQEKNIQSNEEKPVSNLVKTPSSSKPKRPAPPPPPQRAVSQQAQVPSQTVSPDLESVSSFVATSSASTLSESRLKPGEKPFLPKRFAKPKVIRIPRQSSKLQNLAINSRPSSRPAPPRPPPPKLGKNVRGNTAGKVQSNSASGKYMKRGDSVGMSAPNSVKNVNVEHENPQTGEVTSRNNSVPVTPRHKVTPVSVPPITVPSKVIPSNPSPSYRRSEEPVTMQNMNKPDSEVPQTSDTVEDSPKIFTAVSPEIFLRESGKADNPVPISGEPKTVEKEDEISDVPTPTHLYPLETGPTLSPPVVPPIHPVIALPEPTPVVPPVRPPYGPQMSPPVATPVDSVVVPPEPTPAVPPVRPPSGPHITPQVDNTLATSSEVSPEVPQISPPVHTSPVNTPVDSPEVPQTSSPVEIPPVKLPVVPPVSPPIVPRKSPPVEIPPAKSPVVPSKDEDTDATRLSPLPQKHNLSVEPREESNKSDEDKDSPGSPSSSVSPAIKIETNNSMTSRPAPPPKPSRVPPPVLPKPKIKPKPVMLPVAVDMPPEEASGSVSYTTKENGKISNKDIPSPPVRSVNPGSPSGVHSPEIQEENPHTARKSDSDDIANTTSPMNSSGVEVSSPSDVPPVNNEDFDNGTGRHSEDDQSDSDSDEFLRNGDITSDSSATYGSSSDKSDIIHLGTDIGESDDQQLNLSDNLDSAENEGASHTWHDEDNIQGLSPDGHLTDGQSEHPNGDTESYNGYTVDSSVDAQDAIEPSHDTEPVNDQSPQVPSSFQPESVNGQIDSVNGQEESLNGQPESSQDLPSSPDSPPVDTRTEGKPVPRPRTALSPKMERSQVPPARPPPPKSPPPKAHRMVNQGDGPNKPKKKTLRRAVRSYSPQGKGELTFEEGSFIKEMSKAIGRPGWCIGMLADGTTGLYPVSHVEDAVTSQQSTA